MEVAGSNPEASLFLFGHIFCLKDLKVIIFDWYESITFNLFSINRRVRNPDVSFATPIYAIAPDEARRGRDRSWEKRGSGKSKEGWGRKPVRIRWAQAASFPAGRGSPPHSRLERSPRAASRVSPRSAAPMPSTKALPPTWLAFSIHHRCHKVARVQEPSDAWSSAA